MYRHSVMCRRCMSVKDLRPGRALLNAAKAQPMHQNKPRHRSTVLPAREEDG